jgi:hypothetical protein
MYSFWPAPHNFAVAIEWVIYSIAKFVLCLFHSNFLIQNAFLEFKPAKAGDSIDLILDTTITLPSGRYKARDMFELEAAPLLKRLYRTLPEQLLGALDEASVGGYG